MACHEAGPCRQQGCVYLLSPNNFQVGKPEDGVMGTMGYHKFYKATEAEYEEYFYEQCTQCEEEQGLVASETEICLHCRHLRLRHFFVCTSLPGERYRSLRLRLGNLEELRQRSENCVFCNLICAAVETQCIAAKDLLEERLDNMFPELYSTERSVYLSRNRRTEIVYAKSFLGENARGIQEVDSTPLTVHIETFTTTPQASLSKEGLRKAAVSIDRTLSWEKVKGWLEECDSKHQHETQLEKASETILPPGFMVLDVKNRCIVDGTPDCRYIALSYVWGGAFQPGDLAATKSTIEFLKKPGSLNKETVPATIWDSLDVCQELDVPFLWVDRLCIVQDGDAQKMEQINGMDAIYSRAYITICAVGGAHSRAGLCGTTNTPRTLQQGFARIGNLELITELPDTRVWRGEAWWKRGWTYQEYVLSGRSLLFTPWQVSFECADGVFFEGPTHEMSIGDWEHPINSTTFDRYEGIVREYNNRILSWQSDVYNGFIGVFKSLYRNLDQFIYGLPAVDFDKAILWDTETLLDGMIPRYTENNVRLPSWSWVCSKGRTSVSRGFFASLARWNSWDDKRGVTPICAGGSTRNNLEWRQGTGTDRRGGAEYSQSVYSFVAWAMGCIEAPAPKLLADGMCFSSLQDKMQDIWPTYQHFWEEAHGRPNPWICTNPDNLELVKATPGRILLRAAVTTLKIEEGVGSKRVLRAPNGHLVGQVNAHFNDLDSFEGESYQFVALSVCSAVYDLSDLFQKDRTLGLDALPARSFEKPPGPKGYLENAPDILASRVLSSDVTFYDDEEYPLLPPPAVNVMMLGWRGDVAYRISLGFVLLVQWVKLKSEFRTIVLE